MKYCGDSSMVEQDLFQNLGGGSIPTSPLQFKIRIMPKKDAMELNKLWHSRVPVLGNWQQCFAYGAFFDGKCYAVALWSHPVARHFNGRGYLELRRMAICPEAPRFTASRMLSVMRKIIHKDRPSIIKLISYQDCEVHTGTIYKASGWKCAAIRDRGKEKAWTNRPGRIAQTGTNVEGKCNSKKARWEIDFLRGCGK